MNKSVLDVRRVYERVAEVEPLLQLAPLLKARLEHLVETSKKVSQVQTRLEELQRRQEGLEERVEKTGEILKRVESEKVVSCRFKSKWNKICPSCWKH